MILREGKPEKLTVALDKKGPHKDWRSISDRLEDLSAEEKGILEMLSEGFTQPQIGKQLGLHRSAVWRRIKKIRLKAEEASVEFPRGAVGRPTKNPRLV